MTDFAALRRNMVDCQLRTYDVTDRAVLAAMDEVPRELFVPASRQAFAYLDQPAALDELGASGRALMAPMVAGRMLQTLAVKPGQSFLSVGGGTGYVAAIAERLGAEATLCEANEALRNAAATALDAAGAAGVDIVASASGQFDCVMIEGACEESPASAFGLIADGGRLIAIEGLGRSGRVMLYQRAGQVVSGRPVFDAAAPALDDFRKRPVFAL